MIATLDNQELPVTRQINGGVWCPHCDRSRQLTMSPVCAGCGARFAESEVPEVVLVVEEPTEEVVTEEAPATPRRRRTSASES